MANGRRRKKTIMINPPCDIISDLPVAIIEAILTRLPLRDAVRSSMLSRKWRYNWVRIPQLVFDYIFCRRFENNQPHSSNKLMMVVYQVLLLHRGPILKFTLSVSRKCSGIDQVIHFLSRKSVEEFTLEVGSSYEPLCYKLPSSFFSYLQLRHLVLKNCVFKPPPVFNGFSRLISLSFSNVDFNDNLIGDFISCCPLLEELTLVDLGFDFLELDAPMLKALFISARFGSIRCKNTPTLESLALCWDLEHPMEGHASRMIELFGSLPVIKVLRLECHFFEFKLLTLSSFTLNHLKHLELYYLCFGAMDEVSLALCLIKSSPNLEKIEIDVLASTNFAEGPALELFEVQEYSDFSLNQLREVWMRRLSGSRPELEFIKFLLARSPILEKMHIEPKSQEAHGGLRILKELTRFERASPKAEIIYE